MDFESAYSTYEDLIWDFAENVEDKEAENACAKYISATKEIENYMLEEINTWGKCHLESYEIKDKEEFEEMQKKLEEGIIAVHDPKNDKFLIVDGNHRVNTYAHHFPRKRVKVAIVSASIFYGMSWMDGRKDKAS